MKNRTVTGRLGEPGELNGTLVCLASDASSSVTGTGGAGRGRVAAQRSRTETRAPNKALYLTDYARSIWGYGSLPVSLPILAKAPHGDGHGVLVIPGLAASDVSTLTLRAFLDRVGYRTYGWGLGTNIGPTAKVVNGLPQRLNHISECTGSPVSVIGWSLGGILARRLARTEPDQVRQVITLGSPIRLETHEQSNARRAYNLFTKRHVESIELPLEVGLGPLPVPATSIYSRLDGIVAWRACLDEVSEQSENVEVYSSHFGIGHHPAALWVIADRLALRPGEWEPFRAPRPLRFVYPRPKRRAGTHERERTV